jgi:hypothetical protein
MNFKEAQEAFKSRAATEGAENPNTSFTNDYYNYWNLETGGESIVRFLPDQDGKFYQIKRTHTMNINGQDRKIFCPTTLDFKAPCPICKHASELHNAGDKFSAKKYFRRTTYITRAIIIEDGIKNGDDTGKVKLLTLNWNLFETLEKAMFETLEDYPSDLENGTNFVIRKSLTTNDAGREYSSYETSSFVSESTPITDHLSLEDLEIVDLKTYLPSTPSFDELVTYLKADLMGDGISPSGPSKSSKSTNKTVSPNNAKDQLAQLRAKMGKGSGAATKASGPKQTEQAPKEEVADTAPVSESTKNDAVNEAENILNSILGED